MREYNLFNAIQYAEQFAQQIRYILLYTASFVDFIMALSITIYILTIFYHQYHHRQQDENSQPSPQTQHDNYIISTILMSVIILHNIVVHVRSMSILTLRRRQQRHQQSRSVHTHNYQYHLNDEDEEDDDDSSNGRIFLSRISTIVLIVVYSIGGMTILIVWNIVHLHALRQFLSFHQNGDENDRDHDHDTNTPCDHYNIHTYWLFSRTMIQKIQQQHWMNYLYLVFLSLCGIEIVRYHILHAYYSTIVLHHHDDNDHHHRLQESLLPQQWYEPNNDPPQPRTDRRRISTTTSWRTTTITNWWWPSTTTTNRTSPNDTTPHQVIDPVQFQNIQEAWNYRQEMDGPFWWSHE